MPPAPTSRRTTMRGASAARRVSSSGSPAGAAEASNEVGAAVRVSMNTPLREHAERAPATALPLTEPPRRAYARLTRWMTSTGASSMTSTVTVHGILGTCAEVTSRRGGVHGTYGRDQDLDTR